MFSPQHQEEKISTVCDPDSVESECTNTIKSGWNNGKVQKIHVFPYK